MALGSRYHAATWGIGFDLYRIVSLDDSRRVIRDLGYDRKVVKRLKNQGAIHFVLMVHGSPTVFIACDDVDGSPIVNRVKPRRGVNIRNTVVSDRLIWFFDGVLELDLSAQASWVLGVPLFLNDSGCGIQTSLSVQHSVPLRACLSDYPDELVRIYGYRLSRQPIKNSVAELHWYMDGSHAYPSFSIQRNSVGGFDGYFNKCDKVSHGETIEDLLLKMGVIAGDASYDDIINQMVDGGIGEDVSGSESYQLVNELPRVLWESKKLILSDPSLSGHPPK